MSKIQASGDLGVGEVSMTEYVFYWQFAIQSLLQICFRDDHYYQIQSERSQILSEKETLDQVYQALLEEHRTLQTNFDDAVSEKDDALSRLRDAQRDVNSQRNDKADIMMRAEIDRLRADLRVKSFLMLKVFLHAIGYSGRRVKTILLWQSRNWTNIRLW